MPAQQSSPQHPTAVPWYWLCPGQWRGSGPFLCSLISACMIISVPVKIGGECFVEHCGRMGSIHGGVMLKAVLTNMLHQALKVWDFYNGSASERVQRIIHERSIT